MYAVGVGPVKVYLVFIRLAGWKEHSVPLLMMSMSETFSVSIL